MKGVDKLYLVKAIWGAVVVGLGLRLIDLGYLGYVFKLQHTTRTERRGKQHKPVGTFRRSLVCRANRNRPWGIVPVGSSSQKVIAHQPISGGGRDAERGRSHYD